MSIHSTITSTPVEVEVRSICVRNFIAAQALSSDPAAPYYPVTPADINDVASILMSGSSPSNKGFGINFLDICRRPVLFPMSERTKDLTTVVLMIDQMRKFVARHGPQRVAGTPVTIIMNRVDTDICGISLRMFHPGNEITISFRVPRSTLETFMGIILRNRIQIIDCYSNRIFDLDSLSSSHAFYSSPPTSIVVPGPPTSIVVPGPPTSIVVPGPPTSIVVPRVVASE